MFYSKMSVFDDFELPDDDIEEETEERRTGDMEIVDELPDFVVGEYDTVMNKVLSSNFELKYRIPEDFFEKGGFYPADKLYPDMKELLQVTYYKMLANNIIMEMHHYISVYDLISFNLDFKDMPDYLNIEELMRVLVYVLRVRKFNAVDKSKKESNIIFVENYNTINSKKDEVVKSVSYVKEMIFKKPKKNEDIMKINLFVRAIYDAIDVPTFTKCYMNVINKLDNSKFLIDDLNDACNLLNSSEFDEAPLGRLNQLYRTNMILLECVLDFNLVSYHSELSGVPNYVTALAKYVVDCDLGFEVYEYKCEYGDNLKKLTRKFEETPDELDLYSCAFKFQTICAELYNDIVSKYTKHGEVCYFVKPSNFNYWR